MTTISVRPDRQIWSEVDKNGPGGQISTSMKPTQGNMLRTLVMVLSFVKSVKHLFIGGFIQYPQLHG